MDYHEACLAALIGLLDGPRTASINLYDQDCRDPPSNNSKILKS